MLGINCSLKKYLNKKKKGNTSFANHYSFKFYIISFLSLEFIWFIFFFTLFGLFKLLLQATPNKIEKLPHHTQHIILIFFFFVHRNFIHIHKQNFAFQISKPEPSIGHPTSYEQLKEQSIQNGNYTLKLYITKKHYDNLIGDESPASNQIQSTQAGFFLFVNLKLKKKKHFSIIYLHTHKFS